ncbi:hypothetical protein [Lysobacter sp. CA199]|uniref:hypothetical protein n=1 Tax=Lysobacter sp. CA199 TaxID=3455608 RepID=UPI003F8D7161
MGKSIAFTKLRLQDGRLDLRIETCDERGVVSCEIHATDRELERFADDLHGFRNVSNQSACEFQLGTFEPESANGGIRIRIRFHAPGTLALTVSQRQAPQEPGGDRVHAAASMHVLSEPALLDDFISQWSGLVAGSRDEATLRCL